MTLYYAGFALATQLRVHNAAAHNVLEVSPHLDSCCYQLLQLANVCHLQNAIPNISPCPSLCASLPFWLPSLPVPHKAYPPTFTRTAQDMQIGRFIEYPPPSSSTIAHSLELQRVACASMRLKTHMQNPVYAPQSTYAEPGRQPSSTFLASL